MEKKTKVFVGTDSLFQSEFAKTAHGLVRGSDRFEVLAIIDEKNCANDASALIDGVTHSIPIYKDIDQALKQFPETEVYIIGVATVGGVLSENLLEEVKVAIHNGLSIVNGLHDLLSERADIRSLAAKNNVDIFDIRKPKKVKDLHFWTSEIYDVDVPIIAVLGTDCAVGKRTTAKIFVEECMKNGINAHMIYTGQTGWMQGGKYGFIFDATLNDFVSGELVHAILSCWKNESPDIIVIEGQSSLRNPSGPGGSEFIISGQAKQVILVHEPGRKFYDHDPKWGPLKSLESEIKLIEQLGANVISIALNTKGLSAQFVNEIRGKLALKYNLPIVLPIEEGLEPVLTQIKNLNK